MNKDEVYVELVNKYFEYHHDTDIGGFVISVITKLRHKDVHPEDCAQHLHFTLSDLILHPPQRKE